MSRGDRVAANGNLSTSMRKNYGEHGVPEARNLSNEVGIDSPISTSHSTTKRLAQPIATRTILAYAFVSFHG